MRRGLAKISAWLLRAVVLATVADGGGALACTTSGPNRVVITAGTSVNVSPAYDPYAVGDRIQTFTVTVTNPSPTQTCNFALSFTRASLPATMTNGSTTLQYTIESTGGATLLQTTGFVFLTSPPAANRLAGFVGVSSSVNLTVRIRIPAGQTSASAGSYTDNTVTIGIYRLIIGLPIAIVDERTFTVTTTIAPACILPAPDNTSLNFTSAISAGLPDPLVVLRSTFTGVACTQRSRLRLSGSALQPSPAIGAVAGFDNFIDWQAVGVFGAATTTLTTSSASVATSAGYNVPSGAFTGATITVDVNLLAGNPIQAGTYSGVLTVTIDPNL
jgi:hypothetical protein